MLFLRRSDGRLEVASPSTPSLPAIPHAPQPGPADVFSDVRSELAAFLDAPQVTETQKVDLIQRLGTASDDWATEILRPQLSSDTAAVRASAAAALIRHYLQRWPARKDS